MINAFLISSAAEFEVDSISTGLSKQYSTAKTTLWCDERAIKSFGEKKIFISGYVLPRIKIDSDLENGDQHLLVQQIHCKYENWWNYLKGAFNIIICENDKITILNDHLGLKSFYYTEETNEVQVSNNFNLIKSSEDINSTSIAIKALLHREINTQTIFKQVLKSVGSTKITISENTFDFITYWNPGNLLKPLNTKLNLNYFSDLIKNQVSQIEKWLKPAQFYITLTGGKDSRTTLAAMLSQKVKPIGFTYGNPTSKDATYAKLMAEKVGIEHKVFNPPNNHDWLEESYKYIAECGHPWINVHRAHRLFSFQKASENSRKNNTYFAGYMGGELLMGIYYDNLVFTQYLTNLWEKKIKISQIDELLDKSFIRKEKTDRPAILKALKQLRTIDPQLNKFEKQFHGIFEIGVLHHTQDIELASNYFKYPFPFFLDIDFLEALFQSKYHFKFTNNKTKNLFKRYKLYKFNLEIQHQLYENLDDIPFAKKGEYSTREFRKGILYWTFIKAYRYLGKNKKYPSSYAYSNNYRDFVLKKLELIAKDSKSEIHKYYKVGEAVNQLIAAKDLRAEKDWHRFTNIIMAYSQLEQIKSKKDIFNEV